MIDSLTIVTIGLVLATIGLVFATRKMADYARKQTAIQMASLVGVLGERFSRYYDAFRIVTSDATKKQRDAVDELFDFFVEIGFYIDRGYIEESFIGLYSSRLEYITKHQVGIPTLDLIKQGNPDQYKKFERVLKLSEKYKTKEQV